LSYPGHSVIVLVITALPRHRSDADRPVPGQLNLDEVPPHAVEQEQGVAMTTTASDNNRPPAVYSAAVDKGLRPGTLGLLSSVVIGVASAAPAYSLAATLGLVVIAVGLQSPVIVVLAFVPMLFIAIGYKELNEADPDCGTTFTWCTRAFGPYVGWMGGWGIVVADVLVMASLAQVAGQYTFLLFNARGIGTDPTSGWVLLVGVAFMVLMTYLCVRGLEISAAVQRVLLTIEFVMLVIFAVVALVRVATGNAPPGSLTPSVSWFNPFALDSFGTLVTGVLLMIFIYWGWDSTVSVNEETADKERTPGKAAVLSTILLVAVYVLVTVAAQSFAGVGTDGVGLANPDNVGDVVGSVGAAVFGAGALGSVLSHLLLLMVLTSAAASTQTTILPTARTTLSMAVYKALPASFARMHPRFLTPTVSTIGMGLVSVVVYVAFNFLSCGNLVYDAVSAIGIAIGFYYGLTGFACAWLFRRTLGTSVRNLFQRGVFPFLGGVILFFAVGWTAVKVWAPDAGYTSWTLPFAPHWQIGGVFLLGVGSMVLGLPLLVGMRLHNPEFFRGGPPGKGLPTRSTEVLARS